MSVTPIAGKPEELLDAEQWERSDENSLYEACLALVNAGLKGPDRRVHITDDGNEIVVVDWNIGDAGWNTAVKRVKRQAKIAQQSRKHRKQVQEELLNTAAAKKDN
jgi:hypothetical protein